jgi:hypothetical protein
MPERASSHPSARLPVPEDVGDVLLWQLAVDVAAAHRPGSNGRCTSLLCTNQPAYPCPPVGAAHMAAHAARRPLSPQQPRRPTPAARGRATVPARVDQAPPPVAATASDNRQPDRRQRPGHGLWPPPLRRPEVPRAA